MNNGKNNQIKILNQIILSKNDEIKKLKERFNLIEKQLGNINNKYLLWNDGVEWIISLNGDEKHSKTLHEFIFNDKK